MSEPRVTLPAMRLRELFGEAAGAAPDADVTSLAYDDRKVVPGTAFFCVPGHTRDGHDFAAEAVRRGAAALVVQRPLGLGVPEVPVDDVRAVMPLAAARLNGDPTARLLMVGVTGTNGKTTTAYLVRSLLEAGGIPTGLVGTVEQIVGGRRSAAVRTTPEAIDLQSTFAAMLAAGDRACVMEVSSHALELHRADAIHWDVAIFTNLTQDHLDFHPSMEAYFLAKRRLFEAAPRARIANVDDPYGRRLAVELPGAVTVGLDSPDATLRATEVRGDNSGSDFSAGGCRWRVPLPGPFNVLNALCAIAVARAVGIDDETGRAALRGAERAPGRFEPVDEGQAFAVLVDYAHTPDSLRGVLRAARELCGGRVIVVFGAGGDRDRGKRAQMGEVAAREADLAIVTSDNPRSEPPGAIIDEILAGLRTGGAKGEAIEDRRAAIARAVELARPGDAVVIAGKGHEHVQELAGGVSVPFDDREVAREALRTVLA